MTRDFTESLHQYVSASGAGAFALDGARARRVRSSVARRRLVRGAAAATGALAAVGGVVAGAAYASDHGLFGIGDGGDPSPSPSGSVSPSPTAEPSPTATPDPRATALPSPTDTLVPITWPDQDPSWVVETFGSQIDPVQCGVRLADLPTGAVAISEARPANRDEVGSVIAQVLEGIAQVPGGITDADRLVLSDDMYLAVWTVDDAALTNYPSGSILISTGLEVGFAPWEDSFLETFHRQLWGGYAVVEDGVVVARGHHADATVGAGVINTFNYLIPEDAWPGPDSSHLTIMTRPWQGVEWCPGVTPGMEGRDLVVVAAASAPDGAPKYAWAVLPSD